MKNKNSLNFKQGSMLVVILFVCLVVVAGSLFLYKKSALTVAITPTLPPVESRFNSDPLSEYSLEIGDVAPGREVVVTEVNVVSSAKVSVYKEVLGKKVLLGSSSVLSTGKTNNVKIVLNNEIMDGDVIDFILESAAGISIKGNSENEQILVQKPVGMVMMHYENEY